MGEPEFIHGWSGACPGDNYRLLRRHDGFLILEFEGDNGEWFLAGEPIDEEAVIGELASLAAENYELKAGNKRLKAEVDRLSWWLRQIEGGETPCRDEDQLRQWAFDAITLRHQGGA